MTILLKIGLVIAAGGAFLAFTGTPGKLLATFDELPPASKYCDPTGNACDAIGKCEGSPPSCVMCSLQRNEDKCYDCTLKTGLVCGDSPVSCGNVVAYGGCTLGASCIAWCIPDDANCLYKTQKDQSHNPIPCAKLQQCNANSNTKADCH